MSEEIVYANLKFEVSDKKEPIQELDLQGQKAPPAPPHLWRTAVLILSFLCLLLLIGLGVFGGMFYTTLQTHMVELNKLQNYEEELQRNVSVQLMHNTNNSMVIRKLSTALQRLATDLCQELCAKDPEHKCKPCPKSSTWYRESCYFQLKGFHTWRDSEMLCSAHNASLLKIQDHSTLEFIKSNNLHNCWLGLAPRYDYMDHKIIDENIFSYEWFKGNTGDLNRLYCGYINRMYVSYDYCSQRKSVICVKTANEVKVENVLMGNKGSM